MSRPGKPSRLRAGEHHVALLRAINVGGHNKLAMKDLVAVFADLSCTDVRTYIQSGNVVFRASPKVLDALERKAQEAIEVRFGLSVPIVLRSASELEAVASSNPFSKADPKSLFVGFLRDRPGAGRIAALDPERSKGDEFVVRGREIYIRFGAGAAQTKLTVAWFDKELATVTTMRNLRTVRALCEMAAG